jgi:hypothetical protein
MKGSHYGEARIKLVGFKEKKKNIFLKPLTNLEFCHTVVSAGIKN